MTVLAEGREGKDLLSQRRQCCIESTLLQGMWLLEWELNCSTVGDLQPFKALNCGVALGGAQHCSDASGFLCWIHPGLTFISVSSRKALKGGNLKEEEVPYSFLHLLCIFANIKDGGSTFVIKCDLIFHCVENG